MKTGVYSIIPEARLHSVLETLHLNTGLKVQLIDSDGSVLCTFGRSFSYCDALRENVFSPEECARIHSDGGEKARDLGEAYIFTCHADLNHIAFPLLSQGVLLGTVIVGPFLMDTPDSTFVGALTDMYPIPPSLVLSLNNSLDDLPIISPPRVKHLKRLLDHLLSPLMPAELLLLVQNQQKAYQQARVNETIQVYKHEAHSLGGEVYYEKESELLERMLAGNTEGAVETLGRLIAHVHYADGGNLENLRMHTQSLLSAVSLTAVKGGAQGDLIYDLQKHYYMRMQNEQTTDGLIFFLQEAVESFMAEMFNRANNGNSYVRAALRYMAENYSKQIDLNTVADAVGLSPNYFSSLFRKTVGIGFREQLCRIRVEESKRLLLSTDYPLTDIAIAMGFNDQSYYCKVFKRITGLAPGQYRCK